MGSVEKKLFIVDCHRQPQCPPDYVIYRSAPFFAAPFSLPERSLVSNRTEWRKILLTMG